MPICANCNFEAEGRYCPQCGQKRFSEKDKSVATLFEEAFHFITHFEGKFFTTLKTIFIQPGRMSIDFSSGIRARYYKPVSFYLLVVILYLLFPLFEGLNMEMKYYKSNELYGSFVSRQIEQKKEAKIWSDEEITAAFTHQSQTTSKVLLFLLIPFSALILHILYYRKRRWMYDNFILSTEINIFYLLAFYLVFPLLLYGFLAVFPLRTNETITSVLLVFLFMVYMNFLLRNVFKEAWWITGLKSLTFVVLHSLMLQFVYKFFVFEVTYYLL